MQDLLIAKQNIEALLNSSNEKRKYSRSITEQNYLDVQRGRILIIKNRFCLFLLLKIFKRLAGCNPAFEGFMGIAPTSSFYGFVMAETLLAEVEKVFLRKSSRFCRTRYISYTYFACNIICISNGPLFN